MFAYAENTPPLEAMPDAAALAAIVKDRADALRMKQRLVAVRRALRFIERSATKDSRYFLMKLDTSAESLSVRGFREDEIESATDEYSAAEQQAAGSTTDVVLVRADSIKALRKAYPNYFLDTAHFLTAFEQLTRRRPLRASRRR